MQQEWRQFGRNSEFGRIAEIQQNSGTFHSMAGQSEAEDAEQTLQTPGRQPQAAESGGLHLLQVLLPRSGRPWSGSAPVLLNFRHSTEFSVSTEFSPFLLLTIPVGPPYEISTNSCNMTDVQILRRLSTTISPPDRSNTTTSGIVVLLRRTPHGLMILPL